MADVFDRAKRSWIMSRVHGKNTGPEMLVRKLVHGMGFRYRLHVKNLPGKPDIVLARHRKIIQVHGCFWHGHDCPRGKLPTSNKEFWAGKIEKNRLRDEANTRALIASGWSVLVIWQCQTRDITILDGLLHRFLDGQQHDASTSISTPISSHEGRPP